MAKSPAATFDPTNIAKRMTPAEFSAIPSKRGRRTKSKFSLWVANLKPGSVFVLDGTKDIAKNLMQSARSAAKAAGFSVELKTNPDGNVVISRPREGESA